MIDRTDILAHEVSRSFQAVRAARSQWQRAVTRASALQTQSSHDAMEDANTALTTAEEALIQSWIAYIEHIVARTQLNLDREAS